MNTAFVLVLCISVVSNALRLSSKNPSLETETREFDIILYGATGFTGRLAVQYLHSLPGVEKWAIAGRNMTTLKALRKEVGLGMKVDCIAADLSDEVSLKALASRAQVVVSLAGPYSEYHGENLIKACIDSRTHYADIAGETFWQQRVVHELHEPAKRAGVKVMLGAGFDSIPSDLAVLLSAQGLGGPPAKVKVMHTKMHGLPSGGTLASGAASQRDAELSLSKNEKPVREDPYALAPQTPSDLRVDTHSTNIREQYFDTEFNEDVQPFGMAAINAAIVRRSLNLLFPNTSCSYSEGVLKSTMDGAAGFLRNWHQVFSPTSLTPKRGEGPPEWVRKDGSFALEAHAIGDNGRRVIVKIAGQGDPGYSATAKMLVESGLGLLHSHMQTYGVLTPSSALGLELVQRLKAAEDGQFMQFEVSQAEG